MFNYDNTTGEILESLAEADTEQLITNWERHDDTVRQATEQRDRIEYEIRRRMDLDAATILPHQDYDIRLMSRSRFDVRKLAPIKEFVPPDEWATAYSSQETIKINGAKARHWHRYGSDARAILESARIVLRPKLKIERKSQ